MKKHLKFEIFSQILAYKKGFIVYLYEKQLLIRSFLDSERKKGRMKTSRITL